MNTWSLLIPLAQVSWAVFAGLVVLVVAAAAAVVVGLDRIRRKDAERKSQEIIDRGEQEAERIVKDAMVEAKEELLKSRSKFEEETQETRQELRQLQRQLAKREDNLDNKDEVLVKKEKYVEDLERDLAERLRNVASREKELAETINKEKDALFSIANMSRDEAIELLLQRLEEDVKHEADQVIRRSIERIKEETKEHAQKVIMEAINRCAVEHTADSVVSTIDLPNDDMKGRIIGREGRNIRAFERATGIDVIVDDTPEVIVISGFDGVRREVARRAMEKLIQDGRIHPGRIEEVVGKCSKEVEEIMKQTGREAAADLDVHGLKAEALKYLGRLKYRTSYGQNVLQHSIESAKLCAALAGELGLDSGLARRIGLLHDIGKAVDHDVEGGHPEIGADMAKRWGEDPVVVNAIAAHHEGCPAESVYAVIAQAADAISASRPGARRESLERYIKRLQKLEDIAGSFPGVDTTYAIQAGREVRVIVKSDRVADKELAVLARNVATEIENELAYPGEIKVTVLRETRSV
ncbi:MAG: ribonuclease Y, partial [Planctomycetota bacterium]